LWNAARAAYAAGKLAYLGKPAAPTGTTVSDSYGEVSAGAAVPEPGTLALFIAGMAAGGAAYVIHYGSKRLTREQIISSGFLTGSEENALIPFDSHSDIAIDREAASAGASETDRGLAFSQAISSRAAVGGLILSRVDFGWCARQAVLGCVSSWRFETTVFHHQKEP
jgi:hypothetical protein